MVVRDGIPQHYTFFEIPLNGVLLDPRFDLKIFRQVGAQSNFDIE